MSMTSKARLGAALRGAGFIRLAANARAGHYDDFESPLPLPKVALVAELCGMRRNHPSLRADATDIIQRISVGEFDNTEEELDRWTRSAEGHAALRELGRGA